MKNRSSLTEGQRLIKYVALTVAVLVIAGIASGIAEIIEAIFKTDSIGDMRRYEASSDISKLDMEIGGAAFSIEYSDKLAVESNIDGLKVSESRGKLTVKERSAIRKNASGAKITLFLPKDFIFESAEIETGAADLKITSFSAKDLSLSLGAGRVEIEELNVTGSAKIDGGAGSFCIKGGSIVSLDFDMGVGDVEIRAEMLGGCELDFGMGKASLTLLGGAENYRLDIEKGLGRMTVDGREYGHSTVIGNGKSAVDVECGIGEVSVKFE